MAHKVSKENVEAIYPLTATQEGMLFHQLSHPGSGHYFEQTEIYIRGNFDPACCEQAWNELTKRHEMLRSAFEYQSASKSLHIILKESPVEFSFEDVSSMQENLQHSYIHKYKIADRNRGFDLKHDSLLRFKLFQLSIDRYGLIWSHPHIILDGWSGSIVQSEFLTLYQTIKKGLSPELSPIFPLRNYWDWHKRQNQEKAKAYWNDELNGYDSPATIPHTTSSSQSMAYEAATHTFQLNQSQTEALQNIAAACKTTLNIVLQAIWGVFLRFLNNTDDVLFGIVVSGRPPSLHGIEHFVGLLINALPLRVNRKGDTPFADLIQTLHQKSIERNEYDFLSLPEIHALSPLKNNLFDHLFVFENFPSLSSSSQDENLRSADFTIESAETFEQAHYDFGILIQPNECVTFQFHYNNHRYSETEMQCLGERLQTLIQSVIANPHSPIRELEWLTESDHRLLQTVSHQPDGTDNEKSIVDLWDEQVAKAPERIAMLSCDKLTYKELNERANQLASYLLQEIKINPEDRIAVVLPRNEMIVVALLGILKAGGCYLPIDGIPEQRIQTILNDSQARAVLVSHETKEQLSALTDLPVVDLDTLPSCAITELDVKPKPNQLAYMIYTSGSTGTPKGVLVEHGGFVAMMQEQVKIFDICETDIVLQMASISFDASLSEIFMALFTGATVVIAPDKARKNADEFMQCIKQNAITVITLTPPFLRVLEQQDLSPLRVLVTAGEAAVPDDAVFYAKRLRYFNAYGPSECSVCATIHPVDPNAKNQGDVPIGKALNHLQAHVLDQDLCPVPVGFSGEICITGTGLARGYHQRPHESARAFIHHSQYGKMYRTGDMGKWLDDGNLVFLGRRDNQTKIRGFRIELEEIEQAILQIPEIKQAAVVAHTNEASQELRGFYCGDRSVDESYIRQALSERIPAYMIPNQLIELKLFPINQNGKVDKKALLKMNRENQTRDTLPPVTEQERLLAKIIHEITTLDSINMRGSFQAVGGDSLLAIRVHARLRKEGMDLPVGLLMEPDSLQVVAAQMKPAVKKTLSNEMPHAPCTPVQNWFFQHHKTKIDHFSHCVVVSGNQPFDLKMLDQSFIKLIQLHSVLRTNFKWQENGYRQVLRDGDLSFSIQTEQISQPYNDDHFQEWCDQHASFDLENDLLFRVFDLQWDDCRFIVMIAHHLVVDAVSWQLIVEDLNDIYDQSVKAKTTAIDAGASYFEWAMAINQMAEQPVIKQEKMYWDALNLHQHSLITQHKSNYDDLNYTQINIPFSELSHFGNPDHQSFLYDISLTFACRVIRALTHRDENCLLLSNHGRHPFDQNVDVTRTVGWFTNYYPAIICFDTQDVTMQLNAVQSTIARIPNHGMGYGVSHFSSNPKNQSARPFEFLFNFIGSIQSSNEMNLFQMDTEKTRSSIHKAVEFPFRLCFDILLDYNSMVMEMAYVNTVSISEDVIKKSIPAKINL